MPEVDVFLHVATENMLLYSDWSLYKMKQTAKYISEAYHSKCNKTDKWQLLLSNGCKLHTIIYNLHIDSQSTAREIFCWPDNRTLVNQKHQFVFSHWNNKSTLILWCFTWSDYSRFKEVLIICNGLSTGGMLLKMKIIKISVDWGAVVKWSHDAQLEKNTWMHTKNVASHMTSQRDNVQGIITFASPYNKMTVNIDIFIPLSSSFL